MPNKIIASNRLLMNNYQFKAPAGFDETYCPTRNDIETKLPYTSILPNNKLVVNGSYDYTQLVALDDITSVSKGRICTVVICNNRDTAEDYIETRLYDSNGNDIGDGECGGAGEEYIYNNVDESRSITIYSPSGTINITDDHSFVINNVKQATFYLNELDGYPTDMYTLYVTNWGGESGGGQGPDDPKPDSPLYSFMISLLLDDSGSANDFTNDVIVSVCNGNIIQFTDYEEDVRINLKEGYEIGIIFGNDSTHTKTLKWGDTTVAQTTYRILTYTITNIESYLGQNLRIIIS